MRNLPWTIVLVVGLICLSIVLIGLIRGSIPLGGQHFARERNPVVYWGMILLNAIAAAALLSFATNRWLGE